ncbi:para-nitrobenzyl esterase-like [Pelobates fuscus]|uniref:para-nitrobenzyl esterase-like n=1 Tax=Pelobates fuscus TaxID=191477 RepID=UPI002FE4C281
MENIDKRTVRLNEHASESEVKPLVGSDAEEQEEEEEILQRNVSRSSCALPNYKITLAVIGGGLGLCFLVAGLSYLSGKSACTSVDTVIECGKVRGVHCGMAYMFKGIPYASPPTGKLRWRPPQMPTCWNNTLDATKFGSMCAQVQPVGEDGKVMGSEDCLYVNVWTPAMNSDSKLPVMVWFHGGYLHILSGSEPGYCPTEDLTEHGQVVHVSFNYRLNAFGFMALELLREGSLSNTSGNYGFMDQVAALRWVQSNIQHFGGDPNKVTIYGQSSGGTSVWAMMVSPLAKGLFHRAIDISGSSVFQASLTDAEKNNLVFLQKTGCKDVECLRQLSVPKILQSIPWFVYPDWAAEDLCDLPRKGGFAGPVAVVDGHVVPVAPLEAWKKKIEGHSDVPYVIGTTLQETEYAPVYANISVWSEEDYQWFVKAKLNSFGESLSKEALALYPTSEFCSEPTRCVEKAYMTMVSDVRATCPSNELARRAAEALSSPVYRYVVTYTPSRPAKLGNLFSFKSWFAFHMLDTLGLFGTLDHALGETTVEDRAFQRLIRKYFLHFAKEGVMPNEWPQYPNCTALLSTELTIEEDYRHAQCSLWQKYDMFQYAWIN